MGESGWEWMGVGWRGWEWVRVSGSGWVWVEARFSTTLLCLLFEFDNF